MSAKRGALSLLVGVAIAATGCAGEGSTVEIVRGKNARTNVRDVAVAIINPQPGEVVQNPVRLELVLAGFELGDPTPGADERGVKLSEQGQHLYLIIDDGLYMAIYDVSGPVTLDELPPGPHTVRVIPLLQWHESLKGPGTFEAAQFYVGSQTGELPIKPGAPLLTYIRPVGTYSGADADSVLLDFHLRNARLGPGGHKVRLTIDGKRAQDLTEWVPYYLVGLDTGEHTISLQLRNPVGRIVPGIYNTTDRTIRIER